MTEKRFELINCSIGGVGIQDNTDGYVYDLTNNLVNVLNDLNEENKELKRRLMIAEDKVKGLMK